MTTIFEYTHPFVRVRTTSNNPVLAHLKHVLGEFGKIEGQDYTESDLEENTTLATVFPQYATSSGDMKVGEYGGELECCFESIRYWYHPDYLGSVDMITDENGEVYQYFLYNPWGEELNSYTQQNGDFSSPYRFNGKELDEETGLAYYGARYYDNMLSTWLSVDPLASEYPSFSPYNFVLNNPVSLTDPNGMWVEGDDGNWVAEKGDSWWTFHEQTGMSWDETKQFAQEYNSARGNDNWKSVYVGDVASVGQVQGNISETPSVGQYNSGPAPDMSAVQDQTNLPNLDYSDLQLGGYNGPVDADRTISSNIITDQIMSQQPNFDFMGIRATDFRSSDWKEEVVLEPTIVENQGGGWFSRTYNPTDDSVIVINKDGASVRAVLNGGGISPRKRSRPVDSRDSAKFKVLDWSNSRN